MFIAGISTRRKTRAGAMRPGYAGFIWLAWALSQPAAAFQLQDVYSHTRHLADQKYRAQNYSAAASLYAAIDNAEAAYNQANSLAYLGEYTRAIAAYDSALQKKPQHQDARFNRKIVLSLLKKSPPSAPKENAPPPLARKQQEKKQAQTQWLNLVPDETTSFLQEKFLRDHLSRR